MEKTELKGEKDLGRVKIIKAGLYMKNQVVVRMIGEEYFEYLVAFKGQIYSQYIIITPTAKNGKLTEDQIAECRDLIWAGAEATIEQLLGIDKVDPQTKHYLDTFESNREKVEGKKDGKKAK